MDFVREVQLTDRLAGLLPLVSDRLRRLTEGMGETAGLTPVQQQLMEYIYRSGGATIATLTGALRRAQSSVSELTDRLVERGFVCRGAESDRRKTVVRLTAEGRNWMKSRQQHQRDALAGLLAAMETESKETLRDALLGVLAATDRMRGPSGTN